MRYLIKYTKESNIKFIAHLDLMRTIQKIIRRAELPVKYSNGFNPHMTLSIAQPLSVGVYSSGEYLDLILVEEVDEKEIINRLNAKTASGIKFLLAKKIVEQENVKKLPQAMALIDACRYSVRVPYTNIENTLKELDELMNQSEWKTIKETKKSTKEVDIKPMIFEMKYWLKEDNLILNLLLRSGSREHLSADLVVKYIQEHTTNAKDAFVEIKREEMYFYNKQGKLEPLYNCR